MPELGGFVTHQGGGGEGEGGGGEGEGGDGEGCGGDDGGDCGDGEGDSPTPRQEGANFSPEAKQKKQHEATRSRPARRRPVGCASARPVWTASSVRRV